jgi:hypothetical protein
MLWAEVTLVITQDSPCHQLGTIVILVITLLSFSSLELNCGDNEYHRGCQCCHMGHQWRHAGYSLGSHESWKGSSNCLHHQTLGSSKCLHHRSSGSSKCHYIGCQGCTKVWKVVTWVKKLCKLSLVVSLACQQLPLGKVACLAVSHDENEICPYEVCVLWTLGIRMQRST